MDRVKNGMGEYNDNTRLSLKFKIYAKDLYF